MPLITKLQATQNSCVKYCFGLKDRGHIRKNDFKKINWLPVSNRVDQCLAVTASISLTYMDDIYSLQFSLSIRTRRSSDSFVVPFYKKEIARKSMSYFGSKIWNDLNQDVKVSPSASSFKHALKRCFFKS